MKKEWTYKPLNSLISPEGIFIDGDWVESKDQDPNGEVRLIQLADVKEFKFVDKSDRHLTFKKSKELNCTFLKRNDVLVARMPEPLGRACLFPYEEEDRYVTVVDVAIIRPNSKVVVPKWLMYFVNAPQFREKIIANASGSTRMRISRRNLGALELPVPPLPEQKRIVAKLDTLFGHLDQLRSRLDKIPVLLKQFRQAVVTQAVTGKLTEEWRKSKELPSSKFLIEGLINHRRTTNAKVKLDSTAVDSGIGIPEQWSWTRLLNIADVAGGVTKGRKLSGKRTVRLPYLRVANVQDGYLDLEEIKTIEVLPEDLEKYRLLKDDILFTEGGDRDKLGRGTLWKNEVKDCIHQNHIFRARAFKRFVLPEYISIFTKSELARRYFFENASQTVNLASINLTTLTGVPIAVPPMEEQKQIVRIIESLFEIADTIEKRQNMLRREVGQLPEAILAKAFRGELVRDEIGTRIKAYVQKAEDLLMAAEPKDGF